MSKWEKIALEDICDILDSRRVPITASKRIKGIYPYYGANGLQDYVNDYIFDGKYVLLAEDGGHFGSKTKPIAYKVEGKFWVNNHAHILSARESVDTDYLCYSLMFYDVSNIVNGTTRIKLTQSAMRKMRIPLPPLEIQKEIAHHLDTVSELLSLRKKQLEELDELIKSVFYDMFGDPVRNDKGWEVKRLLDSCEIITGNTPPRNDKENYGTAIEWIKSDNIEIGEMFLSKASEFLSEKGMKSGRIVEKPSVLMTCIAGSLNSIGNVSINNRPVSFNQQINAITPKQNSNVFFMYSMFLLTKKYIHSFINMSLKGILSKGKLGEIEFISPPISLQNDFASIVEKIEEQKALVKQSIEETQTLLDSLMSQYFDQ